jgi:hypothetical protein
MTTQQELADIVARLNTLGYEIDAAGQSGRYRIRGTGSWSGTDIELVFAGVRGGYRLAAQKARDNGHADVAALYEIESNWPPAPSIPDQAQAPGNANVNAKAGA